MILGQNRVEANRIKSALERKIQGHKEASKEAKGIEKNMQVKHPTVQRSDLLICNTVPQKFSAELLLFFQAIQRRINKASNLMDNMAMQNGMWRQSLRNARSHMKTLAGDALITSACVMYHGPMDEAMREQVLTDWLNR